MSHTFLLVSTGVGAGLTTVSLGMVRALDRLGIRVGFCKPVAQLHEGDYGPERSTTLFEHLTGLKTPRSLGLNHAKSLLGGGEEGRLMEEVIALYQQASADADVVIVEGLVADGHAGYATRLNTAIAKALDAEVILVAKPEEGLEATIDIAANAFSSIEGTALIGMIINKVGAPDSTQQPLLGSGSQDDGGKLDRSEIERCMAAKSIHMVSCISWKPALAAPRMCDIASYLGAKVLHEGELRERRVLRMELCARTLANMLSVYQPNTLLIFPGDREDVFVAVCMAAINGVRIAGILLTSGLRPGFAVMNLCERAVRAGIPVLLVPSSSFETAAKLVQMPAEVAIDDFELIERAADHVANHLDIQWLKARCDLERKPHLSPAAFRYRLIQQASRTMRRIVLPEGDEPRTIAAAHQCAKRGIAECILLGDPERIRQQAAAEGITLHEGVKLLDPVPIRQRYVEPMVALRQHKGLTSQMAEDQLQDRVVLGTMMLAMDEMDGLVSGALHTTANTVRPAFQLIGTSDTAELVSSIFFMCLPEQVVVYGDCAINPNPDASQLADIAIQSADSAARLGLEPRVAMISYSTGESGEGVDVDKVRQATRIVCQRRPDLLVDGPMQYDAAAIASVGRSKAPHSKVAGKANIFVFPDLNTGNTTYKAVQRSAHVVSIGPMLQGLRKPVNDLSRGATVEDIVYTIALTAIQVSD